MVSLNHILFFLLTAMCFMYFLTTAHMGVGQSALIAVCFWVVGIVGWNLFEWGVSRIPDREKARKDVVIEEKNR